jgi:two-component system sensor histidine kinase KdpD
MFQLWTTRDDRLRPDRRHTRLAAISSVGVVAGVTLLGFLFFRDREPDVVMGYLLGVVAMSAWFGYWPAILTALLSVAAFDFFFTLPYYSFRDIDERYLATYAMFVLVALVVSHLTERIRSESRAARRSELGTQRLYTFVQSLSTATSADDVIETARSHLRETFDGEAAILLLGPSGKVAVETESGCALDAPMRHRAREVLEGRDVQAARLAERTVEHMLPLRVSKRNLGILVVLPPANAVASRADSTALRLLDAFAAQTALAFERVRLAREAKLAHTEVLEQERLRNALLSSVSHDLRGPLALIKGAATALVDGTDTLSPARCREYLETISTEASSLNRLLGNLISMTSLEAGIMSARKECVPTEEVIGAALSRVEEALGERPVAVRVARDATDVMVDPVLFQQVLVNLLENAIKYSPAGTGIELEARRTIGSVEIDVADQGPGIPPGEEDKVFEKFHRASTSTDGMGLGLAICRGMVMVHGGTIRCENRPSGGARFVVTLPYDGDPSKGQCQGALEVIEGQSAASPSLPPLLSGTEPD